MGGICGIYCPRQPDLAGEKVLQQMLTALQARGNPETLTFLDERASVAVGHLYPPVFLAPGEPPFPAWYAGEDLVIGLDGSIYEAAAPAPVARMNRHAAQVKASYEADPGSFPKDLSGYFRVALWDRRRKALSIAADRQGLKPFYYYYDPRNGLLVFASEIKAVVAHPAVPREVDMEALAMYLRIGYALPPLTMFRGVRAASAAQIVQVDAEGSLTTSFYDAIESPATGSDRIEDWADEVRDQVVSTVIRVTAGARESGVFLSGGVESTVLLAALQECTSAAHSFTVSYRGFERDDAVWGAEAARQASAEHHAVTIEPEDITAGVLSSAFRQFDGVQDGRGRGLAIYFLSQAAAAAGISSCLDGTGGERVFGSLWSWDQYLKRRGDVFRDPGEELVAEVYSYETAVMSVVQQQRLLAEPIDADAVILRLLRDLRQRIASTDTFQIVNALYFLCTGSGYTISPGCLIPPLHGVEVRNGFGDLGLFHFGQTLPMSLRGAGASQTDRRLLRVAFMKDMPILGRKRRKEAMPGIPWSRGGPFVKLEPVVLQAVQRLKSNPYFRAGAIERLLARYRREPAERTARRLYHLFCFSVWHDFYIEDSDPFAYLPDGW